LQPFKAADSTTHRAAHSTAHKATHETALQAAHKATHRTTHAALAQTDAAAHGTLAQTDHVSHRGCIRASIWLHWERDQVCRSLGRVCHPSGRLRWPGKYFQYGRINVCGRSGRVCLGDPARHTRNNSLHLCWGLLGVLQRSRASWLLRRCSRLQRLWNRRRGNGHPHFFWQLRRLDEPELSSFRRRRGRRVSERGRRGSRRRTYWRKRRLPGGRIDERGRHGRQSDCWRRSVRRRL
jgi:hypothetical protein